MAGCAWTPRRGGRLAGGQAGPTGRAAAAAPVPAVGVAVTVVAAAAAGAPVLVVIAPAAGARAAGWPPGSGWPPGGTGHGRWRIAVAKKTELAGGVRRPGTAGGEECQQDRVAQEVVAGEMEEAIAEHRVEGPAPSAR